MGLTKISVAEVTKHLPARILAFGWPDNLINHVDMKGSTLTAVDIVRRQGTEFLADLSDLHDFGQFDLVLDFGTLEHVSNIVNAFINAANSVKIGGHVIHEIPINMINHGYWNISPVWFKDFYGGNGFEIERLDRTMDGSYEESRVLPWPRQPTDFYYTVPEPCCTLCVAKRVIEKPITIPKCQKMWL